MTKQNLFLCASAFLALQACQEIVPSAEPDAPTVSTYTEAESSGLRTLRPYPNDDDVCELLKETAFTEAFETEGKRLIACPKHERGAIKDRTREGAKVVGNAKHWVLLSIDA